MLQTYTVNWKEDPATAVELKIGKLVYDPVSHSIRYNLQNNEKEIAKQVQFRYTNTRWTVCNKDIKGLRQTLIYLIARLTKLPSHA